MSEKNTAMELTGLERFSHLEDKIFRVVEAFKAIKKENESLLGENQKLKSENEAMLQKEASHDQSLAQLHKEREALKERVEKVLGLLASLEVR